MTKPEELFQSSLGFLDPEALEAYLLASRNQDYLPLPQMEELPEDYEPSLSQHEMQPLMTVSAQFRLDRGYASADKASS